MKVYRNYFVIGLIVLFVAAIVIPSIGGYEINKYIDKFQNKQIVEKPIHQDCLKYIHTSAKSIIQQSNQDPPNILWDKTFGGNGDDHGFKIRKTTDDGFIILGNTNKDFWLIKIDKNGNEVWSQTYGNPSLDEYAIDVQQTSDGGYIIVGYYFFFHEHEAGILLVKTGSDGTETWMKTFGSIYQPADAFSVYQTTDGGYLIFGNDWINMDGLYLIKTNETGDLMWEKNVAGPGDFIYSIASARTDDGGYIITGFVQIEYDIDMFVMKIDTEHDKQWLTTLGGDLFDVGFSAIQASNGKYVVAGVADSTNDDYFHGDAWIVQLDNQGNVKLSTIIEGDGPEILYSVKETITGYIVVGAEISSITDDYDTLVILINKNGDVDDRWILGGNFYDEGHDVYVTSEGDYIIIGDTASYGTQGSTDLWLLKIEGIHINLPPSEPVIEGIASITPGISYPYTFTSKDPEEDDVSYYIR